MSVRNVLLALDSFKDCLSATKLCSIIEARLKTINPSLNVVSVPLSDGGEGFLSIYKYCVDSLENVSCLSYSVPIFGPLGEQREGEFLIIEEEGAKTACIEMAKVCGLEYVPNEMRNPYSTTSHGLGQVIRFVYEMGVRKILLGIGGSATIDAGVSVLYAMGGLEFQFRCEKPQYITGSSLGDIEKIEVAKDSSILEELDIKVASDVYNPLLGPNGAAAVFGPQKGLRSDNYLEYEETMVNITSEINR
jgi:glycerate 2-kinase